MGNILEDSGLLELIQLIYLGSTTASHILDGGPFDKAIRAHILIDAAIYQHIFTDGTIGARHTDQVVVLFEQRFLLQVLCRGHR